MSPEVPQPVSPENPLAEGSQRMGDTIAQLAEVGGVEAVQGYFEEALTDVEAKIPPSERQAVVSFLASEQRSKVTGELIDSGADLIDQTAQNALTVRETWGKTVPGLHRLSVAVTEDHNRIGSLARQGNTRGVLMAHDNISSIVRRADQPIAAHTEATRQWATTQEADSKAFKAKVESGKSHLRALNEAEATTEPDYDGEPKDLRDLIDSDVQARAAHTLLAAITHATEVGTPAPAAITELVDSLPRDARGPELVTAIASFADKNLETAHRLASKTTTDLAAAKQALGRFIGRGQDAYPAARNAAQLDEVFRQQRQALEAGVGQLQAAVRLAPKALQSTEAAVKQLQQQITQFKSAA